MYKINKGVDRPPGVLGIQGMNFLTMLAGGAVGLLVVMTIVIVASGISAGFGFAGYLVGVYVMYLVIVGYSRKYGERGYAKLQARNQFPSIISIRSSAIFKEIRSGKSSIKKRRGLPLPGRSDVPR